MVLHCISYDLPGKQARTTIPLFFAFLSPRDIWNRKCTPCLFTFLRRLIHAIFGIDVVILFREEITAFCFLTSSLNGISLCAPKREGLECFVVVVMHDSKYIYIMVKIK